MSSDMRSVPDPKCQPNESVPMWTKAWIPNTNSSLWRQIRYRINQHVRARNYNHIL